MNIDLVAKNDSVNVTYEKPKVRRKKVFWNPVCAKEGNLWSVLKKFDVKLKHLDDFDGLFSQAISVDIDIELKETSRPPSNSARNVKVIE
jgi:hypothetical protein